LILSCFALVAVFFYVGVFFPFGAKLALVLDGSCELLEFSQAALFTGSLFGERGLTSGACQTSDGSRRILILVPAVGALTAHCRCRGKRKTNCTKLALVLYRFCELLEFTLAAVSTGTFFRERKLTSGACQARH
jgi:hypothetical protein